MVEEMDELPLEELEALALESVAASKVAIRLIM